MKFNLMVVAFLFPGQGSQHVGMGRDLASQYTIARQTFKEADAVLGFALSRLMWEGPNDELNDTLHAQPALFVHSMAALRVFGEHVSDFLAGQGHSLWPAYVAGHSLGELSALAAAGALTFEDGLCLVRRRGELMKRAGENAPGGMAAILGLEIPVLEEICTTASRADEIVQVANDNCPGQVVISGAKPALERALELARKAGARRALMLAVSIAAHSPLMLSAQPDWDRAVAAARLADSTVPVIGNVNARPMTHAEEFRADLRAQLTTRVCWTASIRWIISQGVTAFVEIGSGSVLTGLLKRIDESVTGAACGTPQDLDALLADKDIFPRQS